ncbi:hypothetical protein [Streptomyces sp. NPDC020965]|uniref:hypothetical protein n=1 Tax=Streptomyces sp. NPDC020965 TaxID=3365105 RepID=UPI0037B6D23B
MGTERSSRVMVIGSPLTVRSVRLFDPLVRGGGTLPVTIAGGVLDGVQVISRAIGDNAAVGRGAQSGDLRTTLLHEHPAIRGLPGEAATIGMVIMSGLVMARRR